MFYLVWLSDGRCDQSPFPSRTSFLTDTQKSQSLPSVAAHWALITVCGASWRSTNQIVVNKLGIPDRPINWQRGRVFPLYVSAFGLLWGLKYAVFGTKFPLCLIQKHPVRHGGRRGIYITAFVCVSLTDLPQRRWMPFMLCYQVEIVCMRVRQKMRAAVVSA